MELPLAQFGRCPFKVRVEIRDFFGETPDWIFPPASSRADPAGWAPLLSPCLGTVD